MTQLAQLEFVKADKLKEKPDPSTLQFGKVFTDYMFEMDYDIEEGGWHNPTIKPFSPLSLSPASFVFHYGQAVFEGLKAYKQADGTIVIFRPEKHIARLNTSNERLCIPKVDEKISLRSACSIN